MERGLWTGGLGPRKPTVLKSKNKIEMAERRVERGEWRVKSGEWRAESGEWRAESGEWREGNGEWRVEVHTGGAHRGSRHRCPGLPPHRWIAELIS